MFPMSNMVQAQLAEERARGSPRVQRFTTYGCRRSGVGFPPRPGGRPAEEEQVPFLEAQGRVLGEKATFECVPFVIARKGGCIRARTSRSMSIHWSAPPCRIGRQGGRGA